MFQDFVSNPGVFFPVMVWALAWKGFALWRAGRLNQPKWFVALLVINTLGILEIIYLFIISKPKQATPTV